MYPFNQSGDSDEAGTVQVEAIDDVGVRTAVPLAIAARHTVHFSSRDLEEGNAAKGLSGGVGDGTGHWRLELATTLDIEPNAYIRTSDGFLTSMHDWVVEGGGGPRRYHVSFFNPGSNRSQVSHLRIVNTADTRATVEVDARDDRGQPGEGTVRLTLGPLAARTVTAQALESGEGDLLGRLGDGTGKWHLYVSADQPVQVMSLLRSPTGHLANLSTTTVVADRVLVREPSSCGDPSAVVSIPDAGLRRAVEGALYKSAGEAITQGELAALTLLEAEDREIQSLAGMECATGLTNLDLDSNQIADLSPLAGLTGLTRLDLGGNQVTDLSPLAGLAALTWLVLWYNQLTDITPLSRLTALAYLPLGYNQISDLSPLIRNSGLGSGDEVGLQGNPLNDESRNTHIPALQARGVAVRW